jgi:hypothetical protein
MTPEQKLDHIGRIVELWREDSAYYWRRMHSEDISASAKRFYEAQHGQLTRCITMIRTILNEKGE